MCELMGLSFDRAVSADFSIRAFSLRDEENADGWGLGWYPDRSLALVKEALTWRRSGYSHFLESYQDLKSRIYIAHVRHQTTGGAVTHSDTHPFSREYAGREFCFAHNGTIRGFAALPLERFHPVGGTDSEHVFCHLLDAIAARGERLQDQVGWRWLHETLASLNHRGTLNCLFSDGERLFGYRDVNGWKGLSLRKLRFHEHGERHFEDCGMEVAMAGDEHNHGCVIATRPLSKTGWHDLSPGTLVVLEGGTLRYSDVIATSKT